MIRQIWMVSRELYEVTIKDRKVFYKDRKTVQPIQMIPMDDRMRRRILMSRNKLNPKLIEQFKLTKQEKEEYDKVIKEGSGKIEEKLAEICKKDCLKNGSILQKEEKE